MPDTRAAFTPEICLSDFIQGDGRNPILLGAVSYEPIVGALQLKGMIARRGACVGSPTLVRRQTRPSIHPRRHGMLVGTV